MKQKLCSMDNFPCMYYVFLLDNRCYFFIDLFSFQDNTLAHFSLDLETSNIYRFMFIISNFMVG